MKTFLVFLVLGCASSDKLDLTYLPPPGSEYSGGRPEDILGPLEFPKETYATTLKPAADDNTGITSPEDYKATIGLDRGVFSTGVPSTVQDANITPGSTPFPDFQSKYKVPTTTVSYAFTQTTTHPTIGTFDTTLTPELAGEFAAHGLQDAQGIQDQLNVQNHPNYNHAVHQFPYGSTSEYSKDISQTESPSGQKIYNPNQYRFKQVTSTQIPTYDFQGSQAPFEINRYKNGTESGNFNRPIFLPSSTTQGLVSQTNGITLIKGDDNHNRRPGMPHISVLEKGSGVYQQDANIDTSETPINRQQFVHNHNLHRPHSEVSNQFNGIRDSPSKFRPITSTLPSFNPELSEQLTSIAPSTSGYYQTEEYPSTTGNYRTEEYPEGFQSQYPGSIASTGISSETSNQRYPSGPTYVNNDNIEPTLKHKTPVRPQAEADRSAVILNFESDFTPDGYAYSYDTSNGIHADENGTTTDGTKAKGSYSYIGDDGKVYSIVYTADENGFRPHGDHIPTSPPIPEAIQRIIEQVQKEKEAGIYHDGSYDEAKYGHQKYNKNYPSLSSKVEDLTGFAIKDTNNRNNPQTPTQGHFSNVLVSDNVYQDHSSESSQDGIENNQLHPSNGERYETKRPALQENQSNVREYANKMLIINDRRRPISIPTQGGDKHTTNTIKENPNGDDDQYSDDDKNGNPSEIQQEQHEYDNDYDLLSNHNEDSQNPSSKLDEFGRPISNFNRQHGNFNNKQDYNKIRPIAKNYSKVPNHRPSSQSDYKFYEGEISRQPSLHYTSVVKEAHDNKIKPLKQVIFKDQDITKRRRPGSSNLAVVDGSLEYQPGENNAIHVSTIDDNFNVTPVTYIQNATQNVSEEYEPGPSSNNYNKPSSNIKYNGVRGRPQFSKTIVNEHIQGFKKPANVPRFGNTFGEKIRTIPNAENSQSITKIVPSSIDGSGYQYIPPNEKFEQDEVNRFPNRITSTTKLPYTVSPTEQAILYSTKKVPSHPFMTPNAQNTFKINPKHYEEDYETDDNERKSTPVQGLIEETTHSTVSPYHYKESSYSSVPQQTTSTPQYYDQYTQNIPEFTEKRIAHNKLKPVSQNRGNGYSGIKQSAYTPFEDVPSTTPMSSTYGIGHHVTSPGENRKDYTNESFRNGPEQKFVYSTTPQAYEISSLPNDENTNAMYTYKPSISVRPTGGKIHYSPNSLKNIPHGSDIPSTTYRPNYTIKSKSQSPTAAPGEQVDGYGRLINRPGNSIQNAPSSKVRPGDALNKFGRPIYGTGITPGSRTSYTLQPADEDQNIDQEAFNHPKIPSSSHDYTERYPDERRPNFGQFRGQQKYQASTSGYSKPSIGEISSTFRPSIERIIGEDFSGPKQQQKFDPQSGYYYK